MQFSYSKTQRLFLYLGKEIWRQHVPKHKHNYKYKIRIRFRFRYGHAIGKSTPGNSYQKIFDLIKDKTQKHITFPPLKWNISQISPSKRTYLPKNNIENDIQNMKWIQNRIKNLNSPPPHA